MVENITPEIITKFLEGSDPMERIINIECSYDDKDVVIIYNDDKGVKRMKRESFYPFVWAKQSAARKLYGGDRQTLMKKMNEYGIHTKGLNIHNKNGGTTERLENGYRVMFYAKYSTNFKQFSQFFIEGGIPLYSNDKTASTSSKEFLVVTPVEQFMISTGKRLFKGYDDYNELKRFQWDLETEGLDPKINAISQIGLHTNKGYDKIIPILGEGEERRINELKAIELSLKCMAEEKPDVISGHNSENFDWNFIIVRLEVLGSSINEISKKYFPKGIYKKKKQSILKLGGEIEYYFPTVIWGYNVTDSLHAVRRAQAQDSNMKKADLKYVTKYSNLNKLNRVYVPGKDINTVWLSTVEEYALNNTNGEWYKISDKKPLKEGFDLVSGRYIVERYLMDDLDETDKVELRYNQSNFLLGKLLPTTFGKVCTMGTAATWKMIMLAWSYENDLAIPSYASSGAFTGGLSRLLSVGYVDRVVKLDYNSLYPSIILSWMISTGEDISGVMLALLEYILTEREKFKGLKSVAGKKAKKQKKYIEEFLGTTEELIELRDVLQKIESEESANDKKQLPFKIFGNSFFGGFGAPNLFNWGDLMCAEKTTCIGRASLRLMIKWFTDRGYKPIVGDSFTGDTPVFIKHKFSRLIDITPINELISVNDVKIDEYNREYDLSKKDYYVLCRSGWVNPSYIYRHKTDKDMYKIKENDMVVDVTEDHSLFNNNEEKIKPSEITKDTKLEYYNKLYTSEKYDIEVNVIIDIANKIANNSLDRVPINILNSNVSDMKIFYKYFLLFTKNNLLSEKSKTCLAGLNYIKTQIYLKNNKK